MSAPSSLPLKHQIFRFLLLGGLAAAVNWLVRFPLSAVLPLTWAVLLAAMIGMSVGFVLYRRYVFPGSDVPVAQQVGAFLLVNLVGAVIVLGLTMGILSLVEAWPYPLFIREGFAHGVAIGFGAVTNFIGHRLVTFRARRPLATS